MAEGSLKPSLRPKARLREPTQIKVARAKQSWGETLPNEGNPPKRSKAFLTEKDWSKK